eukprot:INCI15361.1.p1 GENE.INCI15361.1~~INCI15361.1.p1  ORF type:complete len:586 (+),score=84.71 INCI15361.1:233-1990(+)
MSLADLLAFPVHRRSKSAPGALDERLELPQEQFSPAPRRRGSVAASRSVAAKENVPCARGSPSRGSAAGAAGAAAVPPGAKSFAPGPATSPATSPTGSSSTSPVKPGQATSRRRKAKGKGGLKNAHHDRSLTLATSVRLPALSPFGVRVGEESSSHRPAEQPAVLFKAASPGHGKAARLGGLTIAHLVDGEADIFFNDRNGNLFQAPSDHARHFDADLMRTFAKTSGRPSGMAAVRGIDDQVRLLVADRLRKAIVVAGENTFDVMVDRVSVANSGFGVSKGSDDAALPEGGGSPRAEVLAGPPRGSRMRSPRGSPRGVGSPRFRGAGSSSSSSAPAKNNSRRKSKSPRHGAASAAPGSPRSPRRQPFLGPSCVLPDAQGNVYFTDCGNLREVAAGSLNGSVYVAEAPPEGSPAGTLPLVRPIIDSGLAFPSAMAWLRAGELLICESFLNRVLRATLDRATGRWRVQIFAQLHHRFGPTAIVVRCNPRHSALRTKCGGDKFSVFVAHSALRGSSNNNSSPDDDEDSEEGGEGEAGGDDARIVRLTPKGAVAEEYALPGSVYVTSMALRSPESLVLTAGDRVLQLDV